MAIAFFSEGDLFNSNLSIQPDYTSKGEPRGYVVSEGISASVRDLGKAGATLSAAVAAGGDSARVDGVSIALEDTSALVAGARSSAVGDAKTKAEQYAAAAGRSLGAVQSISEVVQSPNPQYLDGRFAVAALPAGSWTSYGDLAEIAGTAAQPTAACATNPATSWQVP